MSEETKKKSKFKRALFWLPIVIVVWVGVTIVENGSGPSGPLTCESNEVTQSMKDLVTESANILISDVSPQEFDKAGGITKCIAKVQTNLGEYFAVYSFTQDQISVEQFEPINALVRQRYWPNG